MVASRPSSRPASDQRLPALDPAQRLLVRQGLGRGVDLEAHEVFLVVSATHGTGEIPTNILPLAETLERERPDLSGHRYGVIALGDRTYQDTFCGGGKKLDRVFAACGTRKLGERLEVDASSQPLPDEEALGWINDWKTLV